jgi:protein-L-isoaspartate O-methyltransferase
VIVAAAMLAELVGPEVIAVERSRVLVMQARKTGSGLVGAVAAPTPTSAPPRGAAP